MNLYERRMKKLRLEQIYQEIVDCPMSGCCEDCLEYRGCELIDEYKAMQMDTD